MLSAMYRRCGMTWASNTTATSNGAGGDPFFVLPMPAPSPLSQPDLSYGSVLSVSPPLTVGLCNNGSGGGSSSS